MSREREQRPSPKLRPLLHSSLLWSFLCLFLFTSQVFLALQGRQANPKRKTYKEEEMAYRGRGRGRGRGDFGSYAAQEPYILFPDVELPDKSKVTREMTLIYRSFRLQNYWKSSPYYLEEASQTKFKDTKIERYSDRGKPNSRSKRDSLASHLRLTPANFPLELVQGSRRAHDPRKVRWNPESGLQKLDFLEKLDEKIEGKAEKGEKEKKEGEDEDNEEEPELEDAEFSDDGDYNQNEDFDDDEDDFNMGDANEDEATF